MSPTELGAASPASGSATTAWPVRGIDEYQVLEVPYGNVTPPTTLIEGDDA